MEKRVLKITIGVHPERLDLAILRTLEEIGVSLSRNQLKSIFQQGLVRLKPSLELTSGTHEIELPADIFDLSKSSAAAVGPEDFHIPILYEDKNLLVLNKGSGVPSLPLGPMEDRTAVNFALRHAPELKGIGRTELEPGLIHRLDNETSGILVFAKNQLTFESLSTTWKTRKIRKIYRAIVYVKEGKNPPTSMRLDFPLGHDRHSSKRMVALPGKIRNTDLKKIRGKPLPAITHLLSSQAFSYEDEAHKLYDLEIEIETGVMHQIRCHLASMGWPILGDRIYGNLPSQKPGQTLGLSLPVPRLWLHAWKISFPISPQVAFETQLSLQTSLPENWPNRN
jgi:23S rRNA pseudouridine1911/1915/1917 synthase